MREQKRRDATQHNAIYYNQILRDAERKSTKKKVKKNTSFAKKKVDFSNYLIVPEDYEGIVYTLYFILIPYIVGITFLFFYVAEGAYDNFSLLTLNSFLIIWAIGYEITAACILTGIFISYLKFLKEEHHE